MSNVAGLTINEELLAVIGRLKRPTLEQLVRLLLDEAGYLHEHKPEGDEQRVRFSCTGEDYHCCSWSWKHHVDCDGECEPGTRCEELPAAPWCHAGGFDCLTCALVGELRTIVAAVGA